MKKELIILAAIVAGAFIIRKRKTADTESVGRVKRRVYNEMAELQKRVPLNSRWSDLTANEQKYVTKVAKSFGYKQPSASTKLYGEAYYNSLRRQYNAIAATDLPYHQSVVYNENGDPIITYRDYGTDEDKRRSALAWFEESIAPGSGYDGAYRAAVLYIADGGRLVWEDKKTGGGVKQEVFATRTNANEERKARISYLASKSKGGLTVLGLAHFIYERYGIDDQEARNAVADVVRNFESRGQAQQYILDMYYQAHTLPEYSEEVPF